MRNSFNRGLASVLAVVLAAAAGPSFASSHREAPGITKLPDVDGTDFYMFQSYEPGRSGFTTIIANYQGLQVPGGGPNYYPMDPDAIYEIEIDNVGDAHEHITFQFQFTNTLTNGGTGLTVNVGGKTEALALRAIPTVAATGPGANNAAVGENETYTVTMITGDRRTGTRAAVTNANGGSATFARPIDDIGDKTIPNYAAYANQFIYNINIPGCATQGRLFAGQRADAFAVNLGPTFDSVNYIPVEGDSAPGAGDGKGFPGGITQNNANNDIVGKKNVATIALEIPTSCLTGGGNGVIGGWTTASLPQAKLFNPSPSFNKTELDGGAFVQVSRLANPLVNELVIGLPDKDAFNASAPSGDGTFLNYVTNPTYPAYLDMLFRGPVNATLGTNFATLAPTNFPRNDLVAVFLTGIATLNQLKTVTPSEMMRLNTAVPPTPQAQQSAFGVAGDDLAGYPNGRRPGDNVTDITLRVAMGALCNPVPINGKPTALGFCQPSDAPTGTVPYTDGAPDNAMTVQNAFPYLNAPIHGAPGHEARNPS
jgi:hypothetical protein